MVCRASGYLTEEQYGNGIITDRVYIAQNGLLKQIRSYAGISTNPTVQSLDYTGGLGGLTLDTRWQERLAIG